MIAHRNADDFYHVPDLQNEGMHEGSKDYYKIKGLMERHEKLMASLKKKKAPPSSSLSMGKREKRKQKRGGMFFGRK